MQDIEVAVRRQRLQALAEETFGSAEKANAWLQHPLAGLRGQSPLGMAETDADLRRIVTILGKIAWDVPN